MAGNESYAPGWPGSPAKWTSSAKDGVGTSLSSASKVWFTLSHGILNEVYFPTVDKACIRDMGLIVTNGSDLFSEEKRHTLHETSQVNPGIPAFHIKNTCTQGNYNIEKEVLSDPNSDVILHQIRFTPLKGTIDDYHLYVLLAPHLGNHGMGNTAWIQKYKDITMLFAERDANALALACSQPFLKSSVGFVGISDGWQDLKKHGQLTWEYTKAENGNVAIIGEIDLVKTNGNLLLSLGFGRTASEAGNQALISLNKDFNKVLSAYSQQWKKWNENLLPLSNNTKSQKDIYKISTTVLRTSESKNKPGGVIASLSIPWGFSKGDDDLGGYHLIWPRDLVETAGAFLASGAKDDLVRILKYLKSTQHEDGHWVQNMWLDGTPYWYGIQMDETAFPLLLFDLAYREGAIDRKSLNNYWTTIRKAASYIVRNGPITQEDRWEEDPGYSPFTLAVEISALLAAADLADLNNDSKLAGYLRETADIWNSNIEKWTYVTDTDLAKQVGVEGYYVRIAPPEVGDAASPLKGFVPIKNRPPGQSDLPVVHIISPDALSLVRFGLRSANDPHIINTIKVIDALLKVNTKFGPAWHRYNDDGYGEHEDGSPYDGTGIGRLWPLLTGERAHYELAAGHKNKAEVLLKTFEYFANENGLISEQIWDSPDLIDHELFFSRPSGSAMPLNWAHAEYIKLLRSLHDGKVFDTPPQPIERYIKQRTEPQYAIWRFNHKCKSIRLNKILRIETLAPATIRWSSDDWHTINNTPTHNPGFGLNIAELPSGSLSRETIIKFTFFWNNSDRWEGTDYEVQIV